MKSFAACCATATISQMKPSTRMGIPSAVACFVLVADGETLQERDGGGALILFGIGLYLLFTRKQISL